LAVAALGEMMACAVLRAEDYDRAKRFYMGVVGLTLIQESAGPPREGMFSAGEGTMVCIHGRQDLPAPQNTALAFRVPADGFEDLVKEVRARGVTFEEYDLPEVGLKTVRGIAELNGHKRAWFTDPEGNIIGLVST
jgi:predicted enzyme related to lactoylglutathione lyase